MRSSSEIVNARRLAFGERSELMAISPAKHSWARDVWKQMKANNWDLNEVSLTDDGPCYRSRLTETERRAFDFALAFASNLDGIQLHNITNNISQHVTSPEVTMCLTRQAYEEALHVDMYSAIVETVSSDPMSVYMTFERDGMLAAKNEYIMRQSRILAGEPGHAQFARAMVANNILEGIYFYSAFLVFYTLALHGKMMGAADGIRLINRDEITHLHLFKNMTLTHMQEEPGVYDEQFYHDAERLFRDAVELETKWGQYIIKGGVLGLSDSIMADYAMHLANERAALIGIGPLYPGVKNPVPWVNDVAQPNRKESNFFEAKVTDYSIGTLEWD